MRAQCVFEFAKNPHGKFYANKKLVDKIVDKTFEILDSRGVKVSEMIESAVGDGSFIEKLDQISKERGIPVKYFDLVIDKKVSHIAKKQDFLDYIPDGPYFDKNRLIITGPPYGDRKKDPSSTKLALKFGTKAGEIAGWVSFIAPVSWLIDNYPTKRLKIIWSENLGNEKFTSSEDLGGVNATVRTAIVICESLQIPQWEAEVAKEELTYRKLKQSYIIQNWRPGGSTDWDYFINAWGQYGSGEVVEKIPISQKGKKTPFSSAISIKVTNDLKKVPLQKWLSTFKQNYKDEIAKYSLNTDNILSLGLFKKFLRDAHI